MAINPVGPKVQFTGVADKIVGSKAFEKFANYAGKNPAAFNAASSLVMAGVLRPAAIMALPDKSENGKKNKTIAACHAIASGVTGFVITSLVMAPISKGLGKVMKDPGKYMPKMADKMAADPKLADTVNKVLGFGPDIILAIPRALTTSKVAGIIRKTLFERTPKNKDVEPKLTEKPVKEQVVKTERPVLDNFKGGK